MSGRRRVWLAAGALALVLLGVGAVTVGPRAAGMIAAWRVRPAITVIVSADDPRLPTVLEAVDHWNHELERLGTPFRLGPVLTVLGRVADADLHALSSRSLRSIWLRTRPSELERFPGDLLIVLADGDFISFTSRVGDRVLVGIRRESMFPLDLPNVLRNVIAHELGHAIGLEHNADETTLMCGRPASCRPAAFRSDTARFFPLTDEDRARLRQLYPPDWAAR